MEHTTHNSNTGSNNSDPEVAVFGESVNKSRRAHRRHGTGGNPVLGMLAIAAGIMLLLNNAGTVPWQFWQSIASLWPLAIVLFGISIMVGEGIAGRVIMPIVAFAAIAFAVIFGLRQVGMPLEGRVPSDVLRVVDYSISIMHRF
jgi:hypothetical protein